MGKFLLDTWEYKRLGVNKALYYQVLVTTFMYRCFPPSSSQGSLWSKMSSLQGHYHFSSSSSRARLAY